ncbi:MAG: enoyl-CoA hydratase/isomerase family protein [Chitinophagaceae bacterium]|nr:enoyl-CoA hydratase/isomerase family protein [Oligoflexus sp.]
MTLESVDPIILTEIVPSLKPGLGIGKITLNAPKTLNSLNLEMILLLRETLNAWERDPRVALVVIQGAGEKAFCAGGDVKRIHNFIDQARAKDQSPIELCQVFFENEYRLDYEVRTYKKPVVIWGDGIVMGGGLGIMNGASHRIVTETTIMAMPEVTIGLYPDVGASKFLTDMPGRLGLFLGLTASRIYAGDALFLGMADYFVPRASKETLWSALRGLALDKNSPHESVSACLKALAGKAPSSVFKSRQEEIDRLMAGDNIHSIVKRFETLIPSPDDKMLIAARASMLKGSPTSLAITFEQIRRSKGITWTGAYKQELVLSLQCCLHGDFEEGVRALLIDKDNAPRWNPSSLSLVTEEDVESHFQSPWSEASPLSDL